MFGSRRVMNILIGVSLVLFIGVAGYLGYSIYQQRQSLRETIPVSRATRELAAEVRKKPNDVDLRMQLAQAYVVAGLDQQAVKQYEAVLKLRKDFPSALSGLGFITARNKKWEQSEAYWRKVVQIGQKGPNPAMDKGLETAYFYLGSTLFEQHSYEEAVGAFKEALRINSTASDTHYLLAMALKEIDELAGYRDELGYALALDPKMPEANYEMGLVLRKEGDKAGAAEYFRKAVDAAPGRPEPQEALDEFGLATEHLAEARRLMKTDAKKAFDEARIAASIDPENVEMWIVVGDVLVAMKKPADAKQMYETALQVDPGNTVAAAKLKQVTSGAK